MGKVSFLVILVACSVFNAGASIQENDDPFGIDGVTRMVKTGVGMLKRFWDQLSTPESIDKANKMYRQFVNARSDEESMQILEQFIDGQVETIKKISAEPITDEEMDELLDRLKSLYSKVSTKTLESLNIVDENDRKIMKSYGQKMSHIVDELGKAFLESANITIDPLEALKMLNGIHSVFQSKSPAPLAPRPPPVTHVQTSPPKTSDNNMREMFNKFLLGGKTPPPTVSDVSEKRHSKIDHHPSEERDDEKDDDNLEELLKTVSHIFGGSSSQGFDLKSILQDEHIQEILQLLGS